MSCEIEIKRYQKLFELKKLYKNLCYEYFGWKDVPKSSFGRWLIELVSYHNLDPILPSSKEKIEFNPIYNEICEDFPVKISPPYVFIKNIEELVNYISKYIIGLDNILTKIEKEFENDKHYNKCNLIYKKISTLFDKNEDFKTAYSAFNDLKDECSKNLIKLLEPSVTQLCTQLYSKSFEYAIEISKMKPNKNENVSIKRVNHDMVVTYKNQSFKIPNSLYAKLKHADPKSIWIMYKRYTSLLIDERSTTLQAAVPHRLMNYMNEKFGVDFECFASPINRHFNHFCSAFKDTDRVFGSEGSFFDYYPKKGSFEANPPFSEYVMSKMVEHMEFLLDESKGPMSFIVFVPDWKDSVALKKLNASKFNCKDFLAKADEHAYRENTQTKEFKAVHDTHIFFLQNEEGNKMWKPTPKKIEDLLLSFSSVK